MLLHVTAYFSSHNSLYIFIMFKSISLWFEWSSKFIIKYVKQQWPAYDSGIFLFVASNLLVNWWCSTEISLQRSHKKIVALATVGVLRDPSAVSPSGIVLAAEPPCSRLHGIHVVNDGRGGTQGQASPLNSR